MPVVIGDFEVIAPQSKPAQAVPAAPQTDQREHDPQEFESAKERLDRRLARVWAH